MSRSHKTYFRLRIPVEHREKPRRKEQICGDHVISLEIQLDPENPYRRRRVGLKALNQEGKSEIDCIYFRLLTSDSEVWPKLLPVQSFNKSTRTEWRLDIACYWLKKCLESHRPCQSSNLSERLLRLLEIDSPSPNLIRLVNTNTNQTQ